MDNECSDDLTWDSDYSTESISIYADGIGCSLVSDSTENTKDDNGVDQIIENIVEASRL